MCFFFIHQKKDIFYAHKLSMIVNGHEHKEFERNDESFFFLIQ